MGYAEKTAYYRNALDECVARGDRENAKLNAIMYMRVLREMAELADSYVHRAYLQNEADWYESIAVLIASEGVSERVKNILRNGIGKNARPVEKAKPVPTPPPTTPTPPPAPTVKKPSETKKPPAPKKEEKKPAEKEKPVEKPAEKPITPILPPVLPSLDDLLPDLMKPLEKKKATPDVVVPAPQAKGEEKPAPVEKTPSAEPYEATPDEWIADVFEMRLPATMVVSTETGVGTGFFITSDGLFLTNHHVVHENGLLCSRISICTGDEKIRCRARFIAADKKKDLALLRAETSVKTPYIPIIADYTKLRPGMDVMVIGNALSFGLAPITGTVKFTHGGNDGNLIYTAPSNHGDSGGPVLNRKGECVGINKSVTVSVTRGGVKVNAQGLTNATPADEIQKLVQEWRTRYGV